MRNLTVAYEGNVALRAATFACGPGELVGVVGPNGAGKSTLLKALLGLVRAESGEVLVDGAPLDWCRRHVGYLPQRSEIDWDYPAVVEEVVAMGRYPHLGLLRRLGSDDRRRVAMALERVGLSGFARRQIGRLSGGQQQRAFLARALAQDARLLLLDEPFAGIDAMTEQLLRDQLRELRDEGATLLVVNHDLSTVGELYDRLLILAHRVVAFGPTTEVFTPERIAEAYGAVPMLAGLEAAAGWRRQGS